MMSSEPGLAFAANSTCNLYRGAEAP
jgi:hypothetical protein